MNLWIRLLVMLARAWRAPRLPITGTSTLPLRVYPNDLDLNLHMNNGRFLTLMDLGRLDLVVRSGLARTVLRRGWKPVVASLTMRFRRPLAPFQRFELRTRLAGWDEHWIYLEQTFHAGGEVAARGLLKTTFVGRQGKIPAPVVLEALGATESSPPLPEWVAALGIG